MFMDGVGPQHTAKMLEPVVAAEPVASMVSPLTTSVLMPGKPVASAAVPYQT